MSLNDVVNIVIEKESSGVTRKSFGVPCIVGENPNFSERIQYFETLADVAANLTNGTSDPEYSAASTIFSQNPRVTKLALGRIDAGDANLTASLDAIKQEDNGWYGLIIISLDIADQKLGADWAESNQKILAIRSGDSNIVDITEGADTTSIAAYLKANGLARSFVIYNEPAATKYADGASLGKIFPFDPGSYTLMFKTLAGVPVDKLSPSQSKNALEKNANVYEEIGGVNILHEGTVGDGEFVDVIIFIDWLTARIQESTFSLLTRMPKVPFTQAGINSIGQALEEPLQTGQINGGISDLAYDDDGNQIGGYVIQLPRIQDVPATDKALRFLDHVKFTAWLAGAIHATKITGVIKL